MGSRHSTLIQDMLFHLKISENEGEKSKVNSLTLEKESKEVKAYLENTSRCIKQKDILTISILQVVIEI